MPDLSSDEFTIPNPYGLRAADFDFDTLSYRAALGFLGDLQSGSDEAEALTTNGGDAGMLVGWRKSARFRRVYAKCQAAGKAERELAEERAEWEGEGGALGRDVSPPAATEGEGVGNPSGQTFVPLEALPATRSAFSLQPNRSAWGGGAGRMGV